MKRSVSNASEFMLTDGHGIVVSPSRRF